MFEDFTPYDDCEPAGVDLPKTIVDINKLEEIGLGPDSSTKDILYELARKGLRDKGITKYENKEVYYKRASKSLRHLKNLGSQITSYSTGTF